MLNSLYAAVSGIKNGQAHLDVIANNIANASTIGFKRGRISFADTLSQTISQARGAIGSAGGRNPVQIGSGARVAGVDTNFKSGILEPTGMITDVAINGKGFFVVSANNQTRYTRAGAFQVDANGNLMSQEGNYHVMGKLADANGNISAATSTSLEEIILPFGEKGAAKATDEVSCFCNLNKNASVTEEWIAGSAFIVGINPATVDTELNTIDNMIMHIGDQIQIDINDKNGNPLTVNFTYGADNDGTTVNDLLTSINTLLGDEGTAIIDGYGKIRITAAAAGENEMSVSLSGITNYKPIQSASTANPLLVGETVAFVNTLIADLDGVSQLGDFTIAGLNPDGSAVNFTFTATETSIVQNLLDEINANFTSATASLSNEGHIVFTDNAGGQSFSSLNISDGTGIGLARSFATVTQGSDTTDSRIDIAAFKNLTQGATGKHSTSIDIYDSLGDIHKLEINYVQDPTTPNKWRWTTMIDNGTIEPLSGSTGVIEFNEDGSLKSNTFDNGDSLTFDVTGANQMSIALDLGEIGTMNGSTQTAGPSTNIAIEQHGYTMGVLNDIDINDHGVIIGVFSNGVRRTLGQIAFAQFTNENGLGNAAGNLYEANAASGNASINWCGNGNSTEMKSGYLEASNVNLTEEFSQMIIAQRSLQASAKVVNTADQILQTVINQMKR